MSVSFLGPEVEEKEENNSLASEEEQGAHNLNCSTFFLKVSAEWRRHKTDAMMTLTDGVLIKFKRRRDMRQNLHYFVLVAYNNLQINTTPLRERYLRINVVNLTSYPGGGGGVERHFKSNKLQRPEIISRSL